MVFRQFVPPCDRRLAEVSRADVSAADVSPSALGSMRHGATGDVPASPIPRKSTGEVLLHDRLSGEHLARGVGCVGDSFLDAAGSSAKMVRTHLRIRDRYQAR